MARQRSHSIEFKRQVAQEFIAGESLYALRWHNSPEFQAALKIGEKYAKFNIVAVNGVRQ